MLYKPLPPVPTFKLNALHYVVLGLPFFNGHFNHFW
jgi:hypothetical protein